MTRRREAGYQAPKQRGHLWPTAAILLLIGCSTPTMVPLTRTTLEAAERSWNARGSDSYHLVVQVKVPSSPWAKVPSAVYDIVVANGAISKATRDGTPLSGEQINEIDFTVGRQFEMLHEDLRLLEGPRDPSFAKPIEIKARFNADTGIPERYERTVGTDQRRVLKIDILEYEPLADAATAASRY